MRFNNALGKDHEGQMIRREHNQDEISKFSGPRRLLTKISRGIIKVFRSSDRVESLPAREVASDYDYANITNVGRVYVNENFSHFCHGSLESTLPCLELEIGLDRGRLDIGTRQPPSISRNTIPNSKPKNNIEFELSLVNRILQRTSAHSRSSTKIINSDKKEELVSGVVSSTPAPTLRLTLRHVSRSDSALTPQFIQGFSSACGESGCQEIQNQAASTGFPEHDLKRNVRSWKQFTKSEEEDAFSNLESDASELESLSAEGRLEGVAQASCQSCSADVSTDEDGTIDRFSMRGESARQQTGKQATRSALRDNDQERTWKQLTESEGNEDVGGKLENTADADEDQSTEDEFQSEELHVSRLPHGEEVMPEFILKKDSAGKPLSECLTKATEEILETGSKVGSSKKILTKDSTTKKFGLKTGFAEISEDLTSKRDNYKAWEDDESENAVNEPTAKRVVGHEVDFHSNACIKPSIQSKTPAFKGSKLCCHPVEMKKSKQCEGRYSITGALFVKERNIIIELHLHDRTAKSDSLGRMSTVNAKCKFHLNLLSVKPNDVVRFQFTLPKTDCRLAPETDQFTVNPELNEKWYLSKFFEVLPPTSFDLHGIKLKIFKNDQELAVDATYPFDHSWKKGVCPHGDEVPTDQASSACVKFYKNNTFDYSIKDSNVGKLMAGHGQGDVSETQKDTESSMNVSVYRSRRKKGCPNSVIGVVLKVIIALFAVLAIMAFVCG